jgi:fumarate hydratase subunit beta
MVKYLRNNQQLPFNVENDVLYHCGPIVKKVNDRWNVLSAGPTTSSRFESYVPELLTKLSFRVILGKGGFSAEVMRDLSRREVTYCAITGGTGVLWAKKIKRVARVHWLDLGTAEAVWEFEVEKLGPVFVALESSGDSIYENVRKTLERSTK